MTARSEKCCQVESREALRPFCSFSLGNALGAELSADIRSGNSFMQLSEGWTCLWAELWSEVEEVEECRVVMLQARLPDLTDRRTRTRRVCRHKCIR